MTADRQDLPATPAGGAPRKRFSWWRALFSIGLLVAVCATINWQEEAALLRHIAWGWVAAAIGLHVVNRLLSAVKWQVLLRAKGLAHPYGDLLSIIWVSNFFGHFLPSAVGGDSLRMWQVARRSDRAPEAVSTVFVERLTGVMSLAALAVLGGLWSFARWGEHAIVVTLLVPLAALLVILTALWTPQGEGLLRWTLSHFRRLPGYQFLTQAVEAVQSFRHHPRPLLASLAISLIVQFNRVAAVLCLARAAGTTLYLGEAFVVVPSALFIAMLPLTVGGLGLHEGAFVVLLGFVDVGKPAAFALALLNRFAAMTSNVPGGLLFLAEGFWRRRDDRKMPPPEPARPLRVLWLADKLGYGDRLHGLGHYYLRVIPACRELAVIPAVLRCTPGAQEQFAVQGLSLRTFRGALYDPRLFFRIRRLVLAERMDAIQVHGYRATALGRAVGWATGRPVIVRQGDSVPVGSVAQWCDRLFGWTTREAIAVSDSVRRFCIEQRGIPERSVHVIPNAVAPYSNGAARPLAGVPQDARLIGSITRFHPVKGTMHLVEAMAEVVRAVPAVHLVLWGDGPQRAQLEARAHTLGLGAHIHWLGYQPDAAAHLGRLSCFVLPSLSEGSPNAMLEAMAAGRPIVATRAGGIMELIRDGAEALLVEPGDSNALAAAVIRVLTEPALAERLGRSAAAASRQFTMAAHTTALQRVYQRALVAAVRRS